MTLGLALQFHCFRVRLNVATSHLVQVTLLVHNHGAQAIARVQGINSQIGAPNARKGVGDVMINRQIALQIALHQYGDLGTTLEASKCRSLPHSSRNQLEGTSRNFMTRRGDTDDARYAPSPVAALQGGPHYLDVAGTVKRVIDSPIGHYSGNVTLNGPVHLRGIHTIRGTELLGHFKLFGIDVDCNYLYCACHFRALNHSKAL
jgi:hypothetical protein